jgi:hypothetical protein
LTNKQSRIYRNINPFFAFFVVIITTPFAALDPYKALAAAPFNTLIDSISFGFISAAAFP